MRKFRKRTALLVSVLLIVLWSILGTGASLAWFTDTDEPIRNVIHFAEFDLEVSHRLPDGTWEAIGQDTKIFDDGALYEPGYVQVVYLKIENKGTVPFDYKTALSVTDYTIAINYYGQSFHLQDYLRFGLATADSELQMDALVENRDLANFIATEPLGNYYQNEFETDTSSLDAGAAVYMVLIVRMPENVDNVANYRGNDIPRVELGLIVTATQQRN